ncbi:hypothetical protein AAHA92_06783 [Salvia divinorum]|uniref:Uncharacterized protein n=1 Tax=Salvia divinorum TaxID=28513 RepID=A0ABD1I9E3_SALDI
MKEAEEDTTFQEDEVEVHENFDDVQFTDPPRRDPSGAVVSILREVEEKEEEEEEEEEEKEEEDDNNDDGGNSNGSMGLEEELKSRFVTADSVQSLFRHYRICGSSDKQDYCKG